MARIYVEAHGCAASYSDSEMISGILSGAGHTLTGDRSESDIGVLVTCSVKDATANKMIHRIKTMGDRPLVVAGCMPKAEQKTVEKFADNASLMGPNSIGSTLDVVNDTLVGIRREELSVDKSDKLTLPRVRINQSISIVQIATGCMSDCSFCQTKLAKGDISSHRIGDIVRQVRHDVQDGCKEIWLSSTDNGCYGLDIGTDLPSLINAIVKIDGDFMIRVGMMNPMYMPRIRDSLLKSYESEKVYKFLHLPVQSGSDDTLMGMRRGHTSKTFRSVVEQFRRKFPRSTISTDIIVGFPTETDEDFAGTVSLIKDMRPDMVNLSRYAARPGTEAAQMTQISPDIVKQRSRTLHDITRRISLESNKQWIGWQGEVLFSEMSSGGVRGRNKAYRPIHVDGAELSVCQNVLVNNATEHGLAGIIV